MAVLMSVTSLSVSFFIREHAKIMKNECKKNERYVWVTVTPSKNSTEFLHSWLDKD